MISESIRHPCISTGVQAAGAVYFVSRHPGAIAWANRQRWAGGARFVAHLDIDSIAAGDTVIGTLPVQLVAAVCERRARYFHLVIALESQQRGKELTPAQLDAAGAYLSPYIVMPDCAGLPDWEGATHDDPSS